jgi:DNA repair exonuclease SbcCD ATPase subunit
MILRRLQVQHLRCFRNLISVGPFGDGINLLYGPNESGKSTLLEAAALALLDKHSTTGKDIDSFVPWGTSLRNSNKTP